MKRTIAGLLLAAALVSPAAAQEGNAEEGAEVFKKCRACHDLGPGAANKVGPVLNEIIGRKAGTVADFAYSDANKASGITWNKDSFMKYIDNPAAMVPGTRMAFGGIKDPMEVANLWAYVNEFKADGSKK